MRNVVATIHTWHRSGLLFVFGRSDKLVTMCHRCVPRSGMHGNRPHVGFNKRSPTAHSALRNVIPTRTFVQEPIPTNGLHPHIARAQRILKTNHDNHVRWWNPNVSSTRSVRVQPSTYMYVRTSQMGPKKSNQTLRIRRTDLEDEPWRSWLSFVRSKGVDVEKDAGRISGFLDPYGGQNPQQCCLGAQGTQ